MVLKSESLFLQAKFFVMAKQDKNSPKSEDFVEKLAHADDAIGESLTRTQEFAIRYKKQIFTVIGIIAAAAVTVWYYFHSLEAAEEQAQKELFPAVFYFEKDSLRTAQFGDGGNTTIGFEKIVEEYGSTKAGMQARVYLGYIYLSNNKFDQAIEVLKGFSASDFLLQARVYCLLGDAYSEKGDIDQAINYYKKAAYYKPNEQFSPMYMLKLGIAYQSKGDLKSAASTFREIVENFPRCIEVNDAKKLLAMTE